MLVFRLIKHWNVFLLSLGFIIWWKHMKPNKVKAFMRPLSNSLWFFHSRFHELLTGFEFLRSNHPFCDSDSAKRELFSFIFGRGGGGDWRFYFYSTCYLKDNLKKLWEELKDSWLVSLCFEKVFEWTVWMKNFGIIFKTVLCEKLKEEKSFKIWKLI